MAGCQLFVDGLVALLWVICVPVVGKWNTSCVSLVFQLWVICVPAVGDWDT